jgi:hypothetical protein
MIKMQCASRWRVKLLMVAIFMSLTGCTSPSIHPDLVVLQDPLPGQGLVYLLRTPYDALELKVQANGKTVAVLPPESYTAVSLAPGKYELSTTSSAVFSSDASVTTPLTIALRPDQRIFYAIAGTTERSIGLAGFLPIPGGVIPLLVQQNSTAKNSRTWKEYNELDARGLITISKLALPER